MLSLVASVAVGILLIQLYRQSTEAQAGHAKAVIARACDIIRDRCSFYVTGWSDPQPQQLDAVSNETTEPALLVGAKVLGDAAIEAEEISADDGDWVPITPPFGDGTVWQVDVDSLASRVSVRARDANRRRDEGRIEQITPVGNRCV